VTHDYISWIEDQAQAIRERAKIPVNGPFDPEIHSDGLGIVIGGPAFFQSLDEFIRQQMAQWDAKTWSGGAVRLPNGRLLILLNPNQTPERARVTIMEEVAHEYFGHKPSLQGGAPFGAGRSFDARSEREAYWTAAASLLPSYDLAKAIWRKQAPSEIATKYGVSEELVDFRLKTLKLWPHRQEPTKLSA
jgi:Zn-dependent peptidase ImmA (M78 family)